MAIKEFKPRKFKLTRKEYREEFLNSEEWNIIRSRFLETRNGLCERCGCSGNDVHHLEYKFLSSIDSQIKCLMLLCRQCHDLAHRAIDAGLLKFPNQRSQVIALTEEKIKKARSEARKKHLVSMMLIGDIIKGSPHGIKLACGILKISETTLRSIPPNLKATRDQISHLNWIVKKQPTARVGKKANLTRHRRW